MPLSIEGDQAGLFDLLQSFQAYMCGSGVQLSRFENAAVIGILVHPFLTFTSASAVQMPSRLSATVLRLKFSLPVQVVSYERPTLSKAYLFPEGDVLTLLRASSSMPFLTDSITAAVPLCTFSIIIDTDSYVL